MMWEKLENPECKYRPHPLWSWNDKMEENLCRMEIDEMAKAGAGGFFMHARNGLSTEYLSEEWMRITEKCIQYAEEKGMEAWGYDEDGWPSGFAGGMVQNTAPETVITWLECHQADQVKKENILAEFCLDGKDEERTERLAIILCSNNGYVDLLNPVTADTFIQMTHEKYRKNLPEKEFCLLGGFFTDEPQYKREQIPFSVTMEKIFEETYGYPLRENLPALFFDIPDAERIRYDYYRLVSELFVKNFTQKLYDWHVNNQLGFTGHFIHEESLLCQMQGTAGVMPHYEYMTMPGMDWLGRSIGSPLVPRQVSSVAAQTGKKQVLSEMFALCGWNVSFEELKWIANWQLVNGVTMVCQHLQGYTLRGSRKRDYPPSLFYQQPYWKEYRCLNDYFGRVGQLFSESKECVKVAVLHPIRSAWTVYTGENNERLEKLDLSLENVSRKLTQQHLSYHYIDEGILKKYGCVDETGTLTVGECRYDVIVLPALYSIDQYTLEVLQQLAQRGGIIFSMGELPHLIQGKIKLPDGIWEKMLLRCAEDEFFERIRTVQKETIRIMDAQGNEIPDIHVMCRESGACRYYFLANLSRESNWTASIHIKRTDTVEKWDLWEYTREAIQGCRDKDDYVFALNLRAMESVVLCCSKCEQIIEVADVLEVKRRDDNAVTLDCAEYRINGGEWQTKKAVILIMKELLQRKEQVSVELKFECEIRDEARKLGPIWLVMESHEKYGITINGKEFHFHSDGFWKDSAFQKSRITEYLKKGNNTIVLKTNFVQKDKVYEVLFGEDILESEKNKLTLDTELESIYLCGDFGVYQNDEWLEQADFYSTKGDFFIQTAPTVLYKRDFTRQGYTFFSGTFELLQKVEVKSLENQRFILRMDRKPKCAVLTIFVNNTAVRTYAGGDLDTDITEYLELGENEIMYRFVGTNRNLLGPHHFVGGESYSVGPDTFTDVGGWTEPEILQGADIWTDRYQFVEFGF